jgi:hypothetical protein
VSGVIAPTRSVFRILRPSANSSPGSDRAMISSEIEGGVPPGRAAVASRDRVVLCAMRSNAAEEGRDASVPTPPISSAKKEGEQR